ncbi:MAG: hypothetical protein J3Q66DRAFT_403336 [Benniella sp.]|nr:MAG: hypothetical protein J3Q66DRAFT_403336 [Benniella sp.]
MRIQGLTPFIKASICTLANDLGKRTVHVDLFGTFFSLLNTKCYSTFSESIKKLEAGDGDRDQTITFDFYLAGECAITDQKPEAHEANYDYVTKEIHKILISHNLDPNQTTIHLDGDPSNEKAQEHKERWERGEAKLEQLCREVDRFLQQKKGSPADIFQRCKNLYRIPREIVLQVCNALTNLGWIIHTCTNQADSCIATMCDKTPGSVVVPKDSDMRKQDVLAQLKLVHPWQLLLLGILTSNDYSKGIQGHGIETTLKYVQDVLIPTITNPTHNERKAVVSELVDIYLSQFAPEAVAATVEAVADTAETEAGNNNGDKLFDNAIKVFTSYTETTSTTGRPTPHVQIGDLIRRMERRKLRREVERTSRILASSTSSAVITDPTAATSLTSAVTTDSTVVPTVAQKTPDSPSLSIERTETRPYRYKAPQEGNRRYSPRTININEVQQIDSNRIGKMKVAPQDPQVDYG